MSMQENLIGYLLKSLDPTTQREVEEYLRTHPEAEQQLELLRQALAPLAEDRRSGELPPPGLRYATLARVAEYRCRDLPYAPPPPSSRSTIPIRSWWRWPDALVAAAILLITVSLVPLAQSRLQFDQKVLACKNNLRLFHQELMSYAGRHAGNLPKVSEDPPFHVAGTFVAHLNDQGRLSKEITITCPTRGWLAPAANVSALDLEALYQQRPQEFYELARNMGGCYAYCLGYRDADGRLYGLRRDPESDRLPLMADRPPFERSSIETLGMNSKNHGGRGQNVLFMGGDVQFFPTRLVGVNRDDIYVNERDRVDAGVRREDTVLGASPVQLGKPW